MKKNSLPVDVRACALPSLKTKRLLAVKQSTFISFRLTQRLSSASPEALDGNYISTTFSHKKKLWCDWEKSFQRLLSGAKGLHELNPSELCSLRELARQLLLSPETELIIAITPQFNWVLKISLGRPLPTTLRKVPKICEGWWLSLNFSVLIQSKNESLAHGWHMKTQSLNVTAAWSIG